MSPVPINETAASIDLSPRFFRTTAVTGSPALAAETIVATLPTTGDIAAITGVLLLGWASFTVGTSGSAVTVRLRQTNASGTVIATSGALTGGIAAAALVAQDIYGFDASPVLPGQVYVMTLQVTSGSAVSTVSAVMLAAIVI